MIKKTILLIVKLYQHTLSPDHGWFKVFYPHGFCRFYPSCSHYSYESIERFGVIKGSALSINRVLRCNPNNSGGIDYVPKK